MIYKPSLGEKTKERIQSSGKSVKNNLELLMLSLPALILIFIFSYLPMGGIIIAFKDFRANKGILGSEWVGLKNFEFFFKSQDAWRITRNTLALNALFIIVGLIVSVAFALMLFELSRKFLVKFYQTVMFFPYFLSWVVVGFMLYAFLSPQHGILNNLLVKIGADPISWYTDPKYWPFILLLTSIWKGAGYSSLIYYATLMGINKEYYEAAAIDGATKWQMTIKISLPFLYPMITILTILAIGRIFYADFGMFFHLTRDIGMLYPTTDVIDTYVYRALRETGDIGMASAAGFYQSMVGFLLVLISNAVVKKFNKENSLF